MSHLLDNLLIFGRLLRRTGIDVHPGRLLDLVDALGHVNVGARDEVYHTCRALLVHRHEHLAMFDRVFEAFWRGRVRDDVRSRRDEIASVEIESWALQQVPDDIRQGAWHDASMPDGLPTWSDLGVLATK